MADPGQSTYREGLSQRMMPREFVEAVLEKNSGLTRICSSRAVDSLLAIGDLLEALLQLPSECIPDYFPEIRYQKEDIAKEANEHLKGGVEPYRLRGRKFNV